MASDRKMYLVVPNCNGSPNTSVKLGDIILHPKNAEISIVSRESAEFPHFEESHGVVPNPDLPTISKEITKPWTGYVQGHSYRSGHVGHRVYTKKAPRKYMCDELETQVLDDAENYIKKRAAAASVMKEMKPRGGLLRKPVYMITGIMIARGLEVHQSETDSIEHKMGGIVSTTLRPILPISATAGYTQTRGSSTLVECYQRKGPVVFAFKVHKLTLGYFHKDMSIDVYPEGGKFGGPGESSNQSNAISIDLYTEGVNFGEPGASSNQSNAMTKGQIEVTEKGIQDIQDVEVTEKDNLDIQEVEAETDLEHIDATPLSMEDLCEIQK